MKKVLRKVKKFRFQLLHDWVVGHVKPCRVADVGGGKGLLGFLLNADGYETAVIDPYDQGLPAKYKSLEGERFRISEASSIPRISGTFEKNMAKDFDLLVGMHAHGSNMKIIEAAAEYGKDFILMPCCVIDEPIIPQANIDWFESLEEYAKKLGLQTERFELNFRGQNKGFYSIKRKKI
jgi:hypothetical protein